MRGYPLPTIYLHHTKTQVAGMSREDLEIIDGQQRINSLYDFYEGAFKLFDPIADDSEARFPSFVKVQPCPWGGKNFDMLPPELRGQFLGTKLNVANIKSDQPHEVRDLFIRLQSGLPLNHQETRDAWAGQFTEFILKLGGKPELPRYPGHEFFTRTLGMKPRSDRGKTRQLAAQIAMLFLMRRQYGVDRFCDINAAAINEFYYSKLDFDSASAYAQRLIQILSKLEKIIIASKHPKLRAHDAIHAVLLVDSLIDDYTPAWETVFPSALDRFLSEFTRSKATSASNAQNEFWTQYGQWTRVNSDRAETIARRHQFYTRKMYEFMQPLVPKDPTRLFGELERTLLFYAQGKKCAECGGDVGWNDCEVHHVHPHSAGGVTVLENGALVHKSCHPKSESQMLGFAAKFNMAKAPIALS